MEQGYFLYCCWRGNYSWHTGWPLCIPEYQRDCKLGTKPVECLPDADEMGHCRLPIHKAIFR